MIQILSLILILTVILILIAILILTVILFLIRILIVILIRIVIQILIHDALHGSHLHGSHVVYSLSLPLWFYLCCAVHRSWNGLNQMRPIEIFLCCCFFCYPTERGG